MNRKKRPSKTIEVLEKRAEGAGSGDGAKGAPRYPVLYQINTRLWLTDLSGQLGRPATLDDIPDEQLDGLKRLGFDWIYLLGIWQTGVAGREVSRSNPEWRREYEALLSDLKEDDICGSYFAVTEYAVHEALGGDKTLGRLRDRLHKRGMRVMLDFVPNHTAPDPPWTLEHPDLGGQLISLEGRLGTPGYEREGSSLLAEGLYVDLPPWGYHVFEMTLIP